MRFNSTKTFMQQIPVVTVSTPYSVLDEAADTSEGYNIEIKKIGTC